MYSMYILVVSNECGAGECGAGFSRVSLSDLDLDRGSRYILILCDYVLRYGDSSA